ncbi:MAG TPA: acyltransferase [Edaphobacter sp.]
MATYRPTAAIPTTRNPAAAARGTRIERLDGVRTIAIALVIAIHFGFFSLGWAGVQLFFVLSGLLITGILRRARRDQSYWRPFYIKRATRILPPMLIAVISAAALFLIPWRKIGLYYIFFAANFGEALYRGESKTLGVMWSLAVEEQFYFLWPFAVRFLNRRQLIRLLIAILIVEPILRALATPHFSTFWSIFFLTPFQVDGLAAGCLLSLILESETATEWLQVWCARLLFTSLFAFFICSLLPRFHREANSVLFNSLGYSLIVAISASFIAYILLRSSNLASKTLASSGIVFVGTISYGIYLFHPLILELMGRLLQSVGFYHQRTMAPLTIGVTVAVSWVSYRYYEQPMIRWGRRRAAEDRVVQNQRKQANSLAESPEAAMQ